MLDLKDIRESDITRIQSGDLQREEEKPTERCVSVQVVEHLTVIPQLHVDLVPGGQLQNSGIAAAVRTVG